MENTKLFKSGKIVSAVVAIVIAGCLIKKEQSETQPSVKKASVQAETQTAVETRVLQPLAVDTTAKMVRKEVANAVVQDISITSDGVVHDISKVKEEKKNY